MPGAWHSTGSLSCVGGITCCTWSWVRSRRAGVGSGIMIKDVGTPSINLTCCVLMWTHGHPFCMSILLQVLLVGKQSFFFSHFFKHILSCFVYLSGTGCGRERVAEREFAGLLLKCLPQLDLGQAETRSQNLQARLLCGRQGPRHPGPSSAAIPAHEQGAGCQGQQPGLPTGNAGIVSGGLTHNSTRWAPAPVWSKRDST